MAGVLHLRKSKVVSIFFTLIGIFFIGVCLWEWEGEVVE